MTKPLKLLLLWLAVLLGSYQPMEAAGGATLGVIQAPVHEQQNRLRFLSSNDAPANAFYAIRYRNPQNDGMPIWGPSNRGVTYIWERVTRQNTGYYGASPWWSDSLFLWDGGASNSYYGVCPYPQDHTGSGTTHWWELSGMSAGTDNLDTKAGTNKVVVHGILHTQALRVTYSSGTKIGFAYLALPSTADSNVIQGPIAGNESNSNAFGNTNPPSAGINFGDSYWWDSDFERFAGDLGRIKIFNNLLSEADVVSESGDMSRLVTTAGQTYIWWGKTNWRSVNDLTDDYGSGRSFQWVDASHKATLVAVP